MCFKRFFIFFISGFILFCSEVLGLATLNQVKLVERYMKFNNKGNLLGLEEYLINEEPEFDIRLWSPFAKDIKRVEESESNELALKVWQQVLSELFSKKSALTMKDKEFLCQHSYSLLKASSQVASSFLKILLDLNFYDVLESSIHYLAENRPQILNQLFQVFILYVDTIDHSDFVKKRFVKLIATYLNPHHFLFIPVYNEQIGLGVEDSLTASVIYMKWLLEIEDVAVWNVCFDMLSNSNNCYGKVPNGDFFINVLAHLYNFQDKVDKRMIKRVLDFYSTYMRQMELKIFEHNVNLNFLLMKWSIVLNHVECLEVLTEFFQKEEHSFLDEYGIWTEGYPFVKTNIHSLPKNFVDAYLSYYFNVIMLDPLSSIEERQKMFLLRCLVDFQIGTSNFPFELFVFLEKIESEKEIKTIMLFFPEVRHVFEKTLLKWELLSNSDKVLFLLLCNDINRSLTERPDTPSALTELNYPFLSFYSSNYETYKFVCFEMLLILNKVPFDAKLSIANLIYSSLLVRSGAEGDDVVTRKMYKYLEDQGMHLKEWLLIQGNDNLKEVVEKLSQKLTWERGNKKVMLDVVQDEEQKIKVFVRAYHSVKFHLPLFKRFIGNQEGMQKFMVRVKPKDTFVPRVKLLQFEPVMTSS